MFGLTSLGVFHTAISLVAVVAGLICLFRDKAITLDTMAGSIYVWTTILTCLTGFGIFQHGGFGKPHALGVLTLITLAVAWLAGRRKSFGRNSRYVEVVAYSATFLFHLIPATTETFTRLPAGHPLFSSPEDPALAALTGVYLLVFLVGATVQVMRLRGSPRLELRH
ncbi:MAG TPA: hypothetical protein VIP05_00645 [Burkholderiaceae bacterium]